MHGMLLAESAVLLCFHTVRMSFLVLSHVVVALFAFCTCQCNFCAHDFHLHLYYRSSHFCPGTNFEHKKKTLGSSIRPYILSRREDSVNIYDDFPYVFYSSPVHRLSCCSFSLICTPGSRPGGAPDQFPRFHRKMSLHC